MPGQDPLEAQDSFIGGPLVRVARKFVERDQVDLAADASHQLDEPGGVLLRVVLAGQQHILERQAAAWFHGKGAAGRQQALQRVHLVDRRHEPVPLLVGRRVERYRQIDAHAGHLLEP